MLKLNVAQDSLHTGFARHDRLLRKRLLAIASASIVPLMAAPLPAYATGQIVSNDLARCSSASGNAILVDVSGFRGAKGRIRVQAYPATSAAWLAKGAWVSRIDVPVQLTGGKMRFCLPVPAAGKYGVAVRHDLNGNGKTDFTSDGGGFSNNPKLSIFNLGKPSYTKVSVTVAGKPVTIAISLQYI